MNDDTNARIQAVKAAAAPAGAAAGKGNPPLDAARLLPMLIDLVAEQRQSTKTLQRTVSDLSNFTARALQDLPATCRQATREELLIHHAQQAGQMAKLESIAGDTTRSAAHSEDCADTLRAFIKISAVGALAIVTTIILNRFI